MLRVCGHDKYGILKYSDFRFLRPMSDPAKKGLRITLVLLKHLLLFLFHFKLVLLKHLTNENEEKCMVKYTICPTTVEHRPK